MICDPSPGSIVIAMAPHWNINGANGLPGVQANAQTAQRKIKNRLEKLDKDM